MKDTPLTRDEEAERIVLSHIAGLSGQDALLRSIANEIRALSPRAKPRPEMVEYVSRRICKNRGQRESAWETAKEDAEEAISAIRHWDYLTEREIREKAKAIPDGWIPWGGGECPVGWQDTVSFLRRSGERVDGVEQANNFNWGRYDRDLPTDIIAYHIDPA